MVLNQRIKNYWEGEAEAYNRGIEDELKSKQAEIWTALVLENSPEKEKLDILDIGTGPGFFPIILTKAGHNVTGIDITESMISVAKENLIGIDVKATLLTMDCQELSFTDNSFDLVVCRNLTWTLADPVKAYKEWYRVLRPGGRLLVFDASWYRHLYDEKLMAAYQEKEAEIKVKFGRPVHQHKDQAEGDALGKKLFMTDKTRPEWDLAQFLETGFTKVFADLRSVRKAGGELDQMMAEIHRPFLVGGEK